MATPLGQITGELQDAREWTTYGSPSGLPTVSSTKAYTGSYAVRAGAELSEKSFGLSIAAQSSLRCGFWLNHNGIRTINYNRGTVVMLRNALNQSVEFSWKAVQNDLILGVNGTCVALTPNTGFSATDTWLNVGVTYKSGGGGGVIFWLNGLPFLTYLSDELPDNINLVLVMGNLGSGTDQTPITVGGSITGGIYGWAQYAYVDDLYVDGDIASIYEAPPPDRFLWSPASGAGASSQWTPTGAASNYQCVDDAAPNDDTDYVVAAAADLVDKYATTDITLPIDYAIVAAIPIALAKVMAAGPTLKLVAADGINSDLESAAKTPGTSYGYHWESMPLAPDGAAWDETKFNAAQFGIKSAGTF